MNRKDAFFASLDNPEADPFEQQKEAHELGITPEMIDAERARLGARFDEAMIATCWLCGLPEHTGSCVLDDAFYARQEEGRKEYESKNICGLCGHFSPRSVEHSECYAREVADGDAYNEAMRQQQEAA